MPFSTFDAASPITNNATKTADQFGYQANSSFTGRQISVDPKSLLGQQPSTDVGVPRVQLKPVVTKQRTNCMCSPLSLKCLCAGPFNSANSSPRCNPCMGKKKQRNQLAVSRQKANNSPVSHHTGILKSKFICAGPSKSANSSPRFNKCLSKEKQRNQLAVSPQKASKSPERHHSPVYSAVRQESYMSRSETCEKHISVDPTSMLREPTTDMGVPRVQLKPVVAKQKTNCMCSPLPLLSPKLKCLCADLSKSANSSPRFNKCLVKRKQLAVSPRKANHSPERHHSPVQTVARQESYLSRSNSCGEGKDGSSNKKPEAEKDAKKVDHSQHNADESFKCGKMCAFLPGFGRAKPVRPTRKQVMEVPTAISKRVSMEMFECGSWSSSDDNENGDSVNLYFDLPLELIRTTVNDANFPVTAAFVFDDDHKGVLKNDNARAGGATKSSEVGRNVRFSTSKPQTFPESPTCITPRLHKPRDEFSAFLEVQSAS